MFPYEQVPVHMHVHGCQPATAQRNQRVTVLIMAVFIDLHGFELI